MQAAFGSTPNTCLGAAQQARHGPQVARPLDAVHQACSAGAQRAAALERWRAHRWIVLILVCKGSDTVPGGT